jgi:hypothetical protein
MSTNRLVEYIEARRRGGSGWVSRYKKKVSPEMNYAYLCGWYSEMLNELCEELTEQEIDRICRRIIEREETPE